MATGPSVGGTPLETVDQIVDAVDRALERFLTTRRPLAAAVGDEFAAAADRLTEFVLGGGKRMRPVFTWAGWLGAGGEPGGPHGEAVLRTAAALELLQACALIHDDIIDSSATRRGRPTLHVEYAALHREAGWRGDSAGFGAAAGILLGDLALAWADDMIREAGLDGPATHRVGPVWSAMRTEVLGGQYLDISSMVRADESVAAAMRVNRSKTAAYTIERPLHLGAAAAGADEALIDDLRAFGTDLGVAFQLRDDLLGVFGDPEVTGKPSGDDLREGKRTVLFASALARADTSDPAAAALLRRKIGTDLSDADVAQVRRILTDLGAVADVEATITELTGSARAALDRSSAAEPARRLLEPMVLAATERHF